MPEVKDPALLQALNGTLAPQPQATPRAPGVIYGRPKPPPQPTPPGATDIWTMMSPADVQAANLDPKKSYQRNQAGSVKEIGNAADAGSSQSDAVEKLTRVIGQLDDIYADSADNGGFGETGRSGAFIRGLPEFASAGTAAYDISGKVKSVNANLAFEELQKMRDNSPTGGALGQVTEQELELLRSTVANLDPNLSQEEFIRQIGIAKGAYLNALSKIDPEKAKEIESRGTPTYNADGTITYDKRGSDALGGTTGGGAPPGNGGGGGGPQSFLGYNSFGQAANDFGAGVGDLVEGVGDVAGIATNPVGQLWYSALGIDQSYDTGQILRDATGLPQSDPNTLASQVNKFGAGAMAGGGAARVLGSFLNPGTAQAVAQTLGRTPIRDTVAGAGAGAGSYAGEKSGIPGGQQVGALAGGLAGYAGANSGFNALMPNTPNALGAAAARQGVDMLPADAGGSMSKLVTTGTKASPLSAGPVVKAAQKNVGQMATRTRTIAEREGGVPTTDAAGENIRQAAKGYAKNTRDRFGKLYDKAHEAAGDTRITPETTIAALDARIARIKNDPSAPQSAVDELQSFRDRIAQGVNVQGLRDARTRLSEGVYDGKIRSTVDSAAWKEILGNLSTDIDASLIKAGKTRAAGLFRKADEGWKARVEHIDEVLQPIVGKDGMKSGEDVLKAIETMARGGSGGNARLSRLLGEMAPEEAGQVRAIIIDRLGKARAGSQDAAGEVFAPSTFLTNWNLMTPQAKASLFSSTQLRNDLNDIAMLAEGMKTTQQMANHSNTGAALVSNVGAGVALAANHPVAVTLGAGAQYLTGKLMASPGFARLLAKSAKLPPEVANRTFGEQLGVLAKNEPLIANDIRSVQQFLSDAAQQSPSRAAAQPEDDRR